MFADVLVSCGALSVLAWSPLFDEHLAFDSCQVTPGYPGSHLRVAVQLLWGFLGDRIQGSRSCLVKGLPRENQVKLTVSVPPSLHVLLRSWAQCEGRELTSVVLQCVELSVRQLKSNGSIPAGAIRNYEIACEERLAASGLGSGS